MTTSRRSDPTPQRSQLAAEHYAALAAAAPGLPLSASSLSVSPDEGRVAFTGHFGEEHGQRACVLDLTTGELAVEQDDAGSSAFPVWSPDAGRLAWTSGDGDPILWTGEWGRGPFQGTAHTLPAGLVESIAWSPAGRRLLARVADPGATLSDAYGSGRIPGHVVGDDESWRPFLSPQYDGDGRRRAHVLDATTGDLIDVVPGRTVWECCWLGEDHILCLVSDDPDESGWYDAELVVVAVTGGGVTILPRPPGQLARLTAEADGHRIALVAGRMSDRGLDSGDLLVLDRRAARWNRVDTGEVDVSDVHWADSDRLRFAGMRGLATVVAEHRLSTATTDVLWTSSTETCGDAVPEIAISGDTTAMVAHGYLSPPGIALVRDGRVQVRLDLSGPRAADVVKSAGTLQEVSWTSVDGTQIDGFVTLPEGEGPFPMVVEVHGGPVWCWRSAWLSDDHLTTLLVAAGYAVLHPNIRGSAGRGQDFVRDGLEDMCGQLDVPDLLSGVQHVVTLGLADPSRIAVSGLSYGGLMAAWIITQSQVFAASISRSPVTEWISQHYASNLPGFDASCLQGDPLDPESAYRKRSPLYRVRHASAPVLLIAGGQDLATPPEQAAMFHRALREQGIASELVIYPEEGHGVHDPRALIDHGARIIDFLDRWLGPHATT